MIAEWIAEKRPGARWLSILAATADEFMEDRIPSVAAGATFFVLLALFPAIGAVAAVFGLFGDRATLTRELYGLAGLVPGGAMNVLVGEITRLAAMKPEKIGTAFAISFAIAIWSASGGVKSLIEGLDIAFEVKEERSFMRMAGVASLIAAVGVAFAIALVQFIALLEPLARMLARTRHFLWLVPSLRWLFFLVLSTVFNALLYRYLPNRSPDTRRWITAGSILAALLWVSGSSLFTWYVQNFGSYDRTYGALGAIVGFLTWIWLSLVVLLLGAELDSEVARQSRERSAITT
jgi:membrane protein